MTAYIITSNKLNLSTTLHVTENCRLNIAGSSLVSDIAMQGEVLTGAYINQISWSCTPGASLQVLRGTTVAGIYDSSSVHDYSGCGMPLSVNSTEPLFFNFLNGTGFCVIELQKVFDPIINTNAEPNYTLNLDFINQFFYAG
jgi:hypothetical protein